MTQLDVSRLRAGLSSPQLLRTAVSYVNAYELTSNGLASGPNPVFVLPTPACEPLKVHHRQNMNPA